MYLEVLLLSLLITNIFISRIFNNVLVLLLLIGIYVFGRVIYGKGRIKRKSSVNVINNANIFTIVSCILFMIIFYFLGKDRGYDINYSAIYRGYVSVFSTICSILIYIIIEFIRRKPLPADKEAMVHAFGFMLLIALMLVITYFDITKLFV